MIAAGTLRALPVHSDVPPGCTVYPVADDRSSPHLRAGELAIVDLWDRTPDHGELFVISYDSPCEESGERLCIVMVYRRTLRVPADDGPTPQPRWLQAARWFAVPYDRSATVEGPFRPGGIERKLVGRIVGLYQPAFEEARRIATTGVAR